MHLFTVIEQRKQLFGTGGHYCDHWVERVSKQLLRQPTQLAQKTIEPFKQTTETMNPNPKNNGAAS